MTATCNDSMTATCSGVAVPVMRALTVSIAWFEQGYDVLGIADARLLSSVAAEIVREVV